MHYYYLIVVYYNNRVEQNTHVALTFRKSHKVEGQSNTEYRLEVTLLLG